MIVIFINLFKNIDIANVYEVFGCLECEWRYFWTVYNWKPELLNFGLKLANKDWSVVKPINQLTNRYNAA